MGDPVGSITACSGERSVQRISSFLCKEANYNMFGLSLDESDK
jgi:hypothetical protein